ncbi:MAG: DNA repair protein RecO [Parachlamydiales bacterium]|nr:DNA repair protein RecO [Parachlamydiales bacterium]
MQENKTEGITLQSTPFREKQRLIIIFTPYMGLLSCIVPIMPTRSDLLSISSGFCLSEFIYKKGRSDLLSLVEASIIEEHFFLRQNLSSLEAAAFMGKMILHTQPPPKISPAIYKLFKKFLQKLHQSKVPRILALSFSLKVLQHEGFIHVLPLCNTCKQEKAHILCGGESLCSHHALPYGTPYTDEEWSILTALIQENSFSSLEKIILAPQIAMKIEKNIQEFL